MTRYARQYNNGRLSCAPVAILNALRFQGRQNTSRRRLAQLADDLGVPNSKTIGQVAKRFGFTRINRCSWQKIGRILIDGNGVIGMVFYQVDGSKTAHAFFIAGIEVQGQQVRMLFTNVGGSKWLSVDEFERLWSKVDDEFWIYAGWQVRSNV
jgi:hypothetical protein